MNKDEISDSLSEKRVWLLIAILSSGFGDWSREERSYSIKRGGRTNLPSVTRVAGVISEAFHQRNRANRKGRILHALEIARFLFLSETRREIRRKV